MSIYLRRSLPCNPATANGIQMDMVATQCPEEHRQCKTMHNQDKLPRDSTTNLGCRDGFQCLKWEGSECTPQKGSHQLSREANVDFYSSAHVTAKCSSDFETFANENSARPSVCDSGEQSKCSKQNIAQHILTGSHLDNNTRLQQRHFNHTFSTSSSSAACKGESLGVTAQTAQCSSVTGNDKWTCPLLFDLLIRGPPPPEETNTNDQLNTSTHFLDVRQCKNQPETSSPDALNCGQTGIQILAHSGGTRTVPHQQQQQVTSPSLCGQPSTEAEPLTDDQIQDFIAQKIQHFRSVLLQTTGKYRHTYSNTGWRFCTDRDFTLNMPKSTSVAHLPTTSASHKEYADRQSVSWAEQCTTAVGQALQEDHLKGKKANVEFTPRCKETEYPQIMANIVATCTKNEADCPVALTAVSGMTVNKNLDGMALKHRTEKEKEDTGPKRVKAVELDSVQGVTDVSDDLQANPSSVVTANKTLGLASFNENQGTNTKNSTGDQHCHTICQRVNAHSKPKSSMSQIQILTNQSKRLHNWTSSEGLMEEAGSVHSRADLSLALPILPENKGEHAHLMLYEDISDDEDTSQLLTNFANTEHEELSFPPCFEEPQYEDISEDENPNFESLAVAQILKPNNTQSTFENECYGHVRDQASVSHTSVSCSPSSALEDGDETDHQIDDDCIVMHISISDLKFEPNDEAQGVREKGVLDDGETGDKEKLAVTNPTHCELHCPVTEPVPASVSPQIEVFDTIQTFLQVKVLQFGKGFDVKSSMSTPQHEMASEGEPHASQDRGETYSGSEDSCETEDSCDYSSASEHNYLTVSRQLLKKRSASLSPERDDCLSEKESNHDEATNEKKGQTESSSKLGCMQRLRELMEARTGSKHVEPKTNRHRIMNKEDIIILDSDTEDESDQNCKKAKGKRLFSSDSVFIGDAQCSQQRGRPPETADKMRKNRPPSAHSLAPTPQTKEVLTDAGLSPSTETSGQVIETEAGSEYVQHETNRDKISMKDHVIILDSDTEDEDDQNYNKPSRRSFSSGLVDRGNASCTQQKKYSSEVVDREYGTAKGKLRETRLSFADSSVPQHRSKLHGAHLEDMIRDACPNLSLSVRKSGQLVETQVHSEHVQNKTNRRTTSKKRLVSHDSDKAVKKDSPLSKTRAIAERAFSSVSNGSGDASLAVQHGSTADIVSHRSGTANRKPQENVPPSVDSPTKLQSVKKGADSTNPVIPCLSGKKPSQHSNYMKLSKDHKDETVASQTPTATSKNMDSCEKKAWPLHTGEQRFVSTPKPANDRHCATKTTVQTKVNQLGPSSRQFSLLNQEGPSTSGSSLTVTSGPLSEARQSSVLSGGLSQYGEPTSLSKTVQSTSVPRHCLPSSKHSHAHNNPSTLGPPHTPTKGPSSHVAVQSSAREQVTSDWHKSFVPTRRDRKTAIVAEEALKTTNNESRREARPGPSHQDRVPRQRHHSRESATPLMKRTKFEAIQCTRAKHRDILRNGHFVGEGYKWAEKPTVARQMKGSSRKRRTYISPRRPNQ